jgi:hypothetical protein
MLPGLEEMRGFKIEIISKPRQEYKTKEWIRGGLPVAPSIMIDNEIIVEKSDIELEDLKSILSSYLST